MHTCITYIQTEIQKYIFVNLNVTNHFSNSPPLDFNLSQMKPIHIVVFLCLNMYRGADKSLARPTSRCILFDGENISFDASLVIYK
jgi:hypothetical protein